MIRLGTKDPGDTDDITVDFADLLGGNETISGHTVTVPAGLTKVSDAVSGTGVSFRVSGGTAGERYAITCSITTSLTRVLVRRVLLPVMEI